MPTRTRIEWCGNLRPLLSCTDPLSDCAGCGCTRSRCECEVGQCGCADCDLTICGVCADCADCCGCARCDSCNDVMGSMCENCEQCDNCCECTRCENCSSTIHRVCPECYRCERCICECGQDSASILRNGDNEVVTATIREPWEAYTVGLELEFASYDDVDELADAFPDEWRIEPDGSLDDGGLEFSSPPMLGHLDAVRDYMASACAAGVAVNGKCGYHVHVGLPYTPENRNRMVTLVRMFAAMIPDVLSAIQHRRRDNTYCCFQSVITMVENLNNGFSIEEATYGSMDAFQRLRQERRPSCRYRAINCHSWFYRGTIEFRFPAGTTNADVVLGWAQWCREIVHLSATEPLSYDLNTIRALFSEQSRNFIEERRRVCAAYSGS